MILKIGDIVTMKKKHPCGTNSWKIIKLGTDCKCKCMGCGHIIEIKRRQLDKNVREITGHEDS